MAELTFRSPGVSTREVDLSSPTPTSPQGVPAAVIGTSNKGPAFVPVTVASLDDFVARFGASDGEKFGPLAMEQWLNNANAGTFVRVLGAGDGKIRTSAGDNIGKVTNAGFVVGSKQVRPNGVIGNNKHAYNNGPLGRTHFLGAFMSASAGSTFFSEAGYTRNIANPVLRGIIMAASGVVITLSSSAVVNNQPATAAATTQTKASAAANISQGANVGTVLDNEFILLLNGLKQTSETGPNAITASFDPQAGNYFPLVLNTDPEEIGPQGHLLYRHYDIYTAFATVTSSNVTPGHTDYDNAAFILSGAAGHNAGTSTVPNYEGFEDRFRAASSPFVISQKFGGTNENLFRVHAVDDGAFINDRIKISIENIKKSSNPNNKYGTFDLLVREFSDTDREIAVLESFRGLSLDPTSDRFMAKVIGDTNTYFDFDQRIGSQKIVSEGNYPNSSNYIRLEVPSTVSDGVLDSTALPVGFRGIFHLVTHGTNSAGGSILAPTGSFTKNNITVVSSSMMTGAMEPPIPMRRTVAVGTGDGKRTDSQLFWGIQFEPQDVLAQPNKSNGAPLEKSPIASYTNYFSHYYTSNLNPWVGNNAGASNNGSLVIDADTFNNNLFSLENVQILTSSTGNTVDPAEWQAAVYRRNAVLGSVLGSNGTTYTSGRTRFLDVTQDFGEPASTQYFKFTFPVQGGFDGTNIYNKQKSALSDLAVKEEMGDSNQGLTAGPTVSAYRKAVDILKLKSEADIQLMAIPGLRQTAVTDYAMDAMEEMFDSLYLMDVIEYDASNQVITGSTQNASVTNTVNAFKSRNLDNSFAAAYFPDVVVFDSANNTNVQVPPSVAVLGAFARNDAIAHPWFAPAGFARGALNAVEVQAKLNRTNLDNLYDARINPIAAFPGQQGPVVFGQKTLQLAQSALDRVNVRRLLIEIRRNVRDIANTFLFEPNRESTLNRFSASVRPMLTKIQQQQGLDRFKVQIDTSTTTQADVENNTIRGKIFLQPTRSVEFIALDFVVTNAGAEI